ncbi:transposase [Mesorhizobium sp. CA8]|uniref:RNA-guided endonuclease InsQ/TnpB family protein n=1 Tax=Mesorhizobium sp. CA8 TaxID=2876637 RepID=UPI001CC94148|nr:RNA-guided endonuclease TnpB family protein [Mesorhizobium sp. CA8]MBZ9759437.1 transposase [Mesorhizobium sp. CA8]
MILRGFRYKLVPAPEQEALFRQFAGVCRLVYNLALEQRQVWGRSHRIGYIQQAVDLTRLRAEYDWIAAVSQTCQQQALRDLDKAFANFFKGVARYPTSRCKGVNDSFRFQGREVNVKRLNGKWSAVRLPKIGWVKFRDTRPMRGTLKNVTVSVDALGWHISFAREIEHDAAANTRPSVGIDRGVVNTLALSTGEQMSMPRSLEAIEQRKRRVQKVVARRKRGSKRWAKALRRVARLSARISRIRKDWHHKTSLDIACRFGTVVLEDLKINNMTASGRGTMAEPGRNVRQKAGLNRSILNQGWFGFETILAYKLAERGGTLEKVDPAYTSQQCSQCDCIDKRSRESQARFVCIDCGYVEHADTNAALNILRRNTAFMRVEESFGFPMKRELPIGNPRPSGWGRC